MLKKLFILLILTGCTSTQIIIPPEYSYKEIKTTSFTLASWQKITNPQAPYKIYIEGDGYAFNANGHPTLDPTPRGTLVRDLAFGDTNPNVIYLGRPCQYVDSDICRQRHWTTARFSPEVINSEYEAVKTITKGSPVILVGFSGGAQVVGLIATAKQGLNIKKIITIAGNLDHSNWTKHHKVPALNESMDLADYQSQFQDIPQLHYVGSRDNTIPPTLIKNFIKNDDLVIEVKGATHNTGWEQVFEKIRNEH